MSPSVTEPILVTPVIQGRIWGGRRLASIYGNCPAGPIGEAWLTSDRALAPSRVAAGTYAGITLHERIAVDPRAIYGDGTAPPPGFPLLIKWLDAADVLSVQIHPSDSEARALGETDQGKMEAWVVIDAVPGARLVHGLVPGTSKVAVADAIAAGALEPLLRWIPVQRGDAVFVPPGTLHAVGAGIVLLEIQNNSDMTYRFYDWNRVDATGRSRALHTDKGLAVLRVDSASDAELRPIPILSPWPGEHLVRCEAFSIDRFRCAGTLRYESAASLFAPVSVLCVVDGALMLKSEHGEIALATGAAVIIPAQLRSFSIEGHATFCRVTP